MLSTVDLELAKFVNPDLTWKRVTKGHRSASKRSRKPARSLDAGMPRGDESPKRSEDSSVSESEKLGVAVLGRRFAEKVEHMPIKKRRLLLRSPSPPLQTPSPLHEGFPSPLHEGFPSPQPQTPSPHGDEPMRCLESSECSDQWGCSKSFPNQHLGAFDGSLSVQFSGRVDRVVSEKLSEVKPGEISYDDDFSGIALLAAAACNNTIEDDPSNAKEHPMVEGSLTPEVIDSSASATPLKEIGSSSETGNLSLNGLVGEENIDGLIVREDTVDVLQNHHNKKVGESVEVSVCSKGERLHWDLNTVMDAWEEPCDALKVDSQTNAAASEKLDTLEDYDAGKKASSSCKMISADLHGNNMVVESKPSCIASSNSNRDESLLESHTDVERAGFEETIVSTSTEHVLEALSASANTGASALVVSTETSRNNSSCHGSDHILSRPDSVKMLNSTPACVVFQNTEDCCGTSAMSLESVQFGKHHNLIPDASPKTSGSADNRMSSKEMISSVTCQTLDTDPIVSSSKLSSTTHENLSALDTFRQEGQPVVSDDVKGQNDKASATDCTLIDSPLLVMPQAYEHEKIKSGSYGEDPTCRSGKIDTEDLSGDCNVSDVSHDGRGRMVDSESMTEPRSGYDSPFEDGELRESVLYSWEENEAEWETECVDYESDKGDADDFDAADVLVSDKVEVERGDALKEPNHSASLKTKLSGWDQLPEGYDCPPPKTGEVNDVNAAKVCTSDCMDASKTSRGNLVSHTDGMSCSSALHRKEDGYIQRSRPNNRDDSFSRPRGEFGSRKSLGRGRSSVQIHSRGQEDGHWVNSSEGHTDSRNHYPSSFHRYDNGDRRPRSHIANSGERVDRRDPRQPINYSTNGVYRPFSGGRSLTERDDSYAMPTRDVNRGGGQGRSRIYPQGVRRGPREDCHGPLHFVSRERSFSPIHSRGVHFSRPYRRSRSRSRTRSPRAWDVQRERNLGNRHHSRSPDFMSGAKMKRMNASSFAADEGERFVSPPRGRFFPQCNSRWIGERDCVGDRFRDQRSPVRIFRQSQRADMAGSPGGVKSDNYFRPVVRPGRYTDMGGRGHKYNGSDDDTRKHGDNYEMIHRVRHYNNAGGVRRFCYDAEENFDSHNSRNEDDFIRSSDRRNVYRSSKEASGGPFKYNSNRMYSTGPKSSGIQDCDENASPRRG